MRAKLVFFSLAGALVLLLVLRCARQEKIEEEWESSVSPLLASVHSPESSHSPDWISLFDGKSLQGWISSGKPENGSCWMVQNGVLKGRTIGSDHEILLTTEKQYQFYELKMEWRLARNSMASIAYRTPAAAQYQVSGLYYQLADDLSMASTLAPELCTGSLMNLLKASEKRIRVAGSWNTSRIIVGKTKVQHWLNNEMILEYNLRDAANLSLASGTEGDIGDLIGSPAPVALVARTGEVEFRNILIREADKEQLLVD